jgi:hypothetical protein
MSATSRLRNFGHASNAWKIVGLSSVRTVVTFQSDAFNTTVVRPYFMNALCFGDDVAQHIVFELQRTGHIAETPAQEDFGWYFRFSVSGKPHLFVLGRRPVEGDWLGSIERVPFLFVKRAVDPEAALAIDAALADEEIFGKVRWHYGDQFDAGEEELGVPHP